MNFNICKTFLQKELKTKSVEQIMRENKLLYRLANKKLLKKLVLIEAQNKVVQENKLLIDNIE
jgi:hypothetical protein|tara:strand:+ start:546 stop:734 length:189 start_codon:yes stop_codon:yes gene_type:complete